MIIKDDGSSINFFDTAFRIIVKYSGEKIYVFYSGIRHIFQNNLPKVRVVPVNKVNLGRVYSFAATNGKTCCVYLVADAFKHKSRKYY